MTNQHTHSCMCGENQSPLRIGQTIPDIRFKVYHKDEEHEMSTSGFRGKWTIYFFYPADFTFVCPTELEDMAELYPQFQKEGAEIVSVSTDTVYTHKAWHDHSEAIKKITYPMAADPNHTLSNLFGVLIEGEGVALRGSFIVDPDGVLQAIEVNANNIGRNAQELLRRLQAAKFVREHGDKVCPANWNPGDDTLEPGMDLVGKI